MPSPSPSIANRSLTPRTQAGGLQADASYKVQRGDSLYSIAQRFLGSGKRWPELMVANAQVLNGSQVLMPGMRLRMPQASSPAPALRMESDRLERSTPAPTPRAAEPARPASPALVAPKQDAPKALPPRPLPLPVAPKPQLPPSGAGDRDRDGVPDRFDRKPELAQDKTWNEAAAQAYAAFVQRHSRALEAKGLEVDCADFAAKLLADFCKEYGLPNPMAGVGTWHEYSPSRKGGLPNVDGPNLVLSQVGADSLAKRFTRNVNDANGNGVAGFDQRTGKVDLEDLRPGDILFYDWDRDGVVNHTMNVVEVHADGAVTLAWGTYDNLDPNKALAWENLDLQRVAVTKIEVGSEEHERFFGEGAALWGVRRFTPMADQKAPFSAGN